MSATTSLILGLGFLGLAIVAVLLQAILWGPKYWNEETKKTEAPKLWLRVHALAGYTYGGIYVFMMWHMVPRLWEYQYELPARTVFHAVVAITIGVLLVTKICILIFFRHFEEAMPRYGFGILLCTVILISLSVPFSLRAHDLTGKTVEAANLARVKGLLEDVDMGGANLDEVVSKEGLEAGRDVLVSKCTGCHDMRTILVKPRTAKRWYDVSVRMLDKPNPFGEQLETEDIVTVTAYLVAITPDLQQSRKRKRKVDERVKDTIAQLTAVPEIPSAIPSAPAVDEGDTDGDDTDGADTDGDDTDGAAADPAPPSADIPEVDDATGEALMEAKCTECHENEELDEHGGDDYAGWTEVLTDMVEEGAEIDDEDVVKLAAYLARIRGKE